MGGGDRQVLFWWALGTAVVSGLSIGAVSRSTRIREDTAIGIIFAGMFALGIALISTVRSYTVDLAHFLFGDILGVTPTDIQLILIFSGIVIGLIFLFYKEFVLLSFDPVLATTLRLPVRFLENLLLVLIAISIVVSLQTVGVALMVAMLITPAATAYLLSKRLPVMMALASGIASFSGITGLYLSYYLNIASGAAIVLTTTLIFFLVWSGQSLWQRKSKKVD